MRALSLLCLAFVATAGCQVFDAPPDPVLVGEKSGLLPNDKAPLVIDFGMPVEPKTLTLEVVPYVVNAEGELADEDNDPKTDISMGLFFQHTEHFGDFGGIGTFEDGDSRYTITLGAKTGTNFIHAPLPIGPRLAVLVDPGLANKDGVTINARRRLVFGYQVDLSCKKPSSRFHSGDYFFLASVKTPITTQVQLYASIVLDKGSGAFIGQFTNADRDRTRKCPALHCMSTEVCRELPKPMCAMPSDPAGTVDEYPDYVPNDAPPTGYSFTAHGCVVDQGDGSVTFETVPVDVAVTQPSVTLRNARLNALFKESGSVLRATGSFGADSVLIGTSPSGPAAGDLTGRSLTSAEAPPHIPPPPAN